jgi:xanthine/uracil permease
VLLGMIAFVGIQIILAMEMTETNKLIVGISTILGIAFTFMPQAVTNSLPLFSMAKHIFRQLRPKAP